MAEESTSNTPARPLWRRLAWFVGLWAVGVGMLGAVAMGWRALVAWLA